MHMQPMQPKHEEEKVGQSHIFDKVVDNYKTRNQHQEEDDDMMLVEHDSPTQSLV